MENSFGRYEVYTTVESKYCYKYSSVLRNKYNIRDSAELKAVEADIYAIKQKELLKKPINGNLSPSHLCKVHKFLFGDIYPFAGHYRTEDISKGATSFLHYNNIQENLSSLLKELKGENFLIDAPQEYAYARYAYYFANLNYIHPFREGNGRSTREFMRLILMKNGLTVVWSNVNHEYLLKVMESSIYDNTLLIPVFELITTAIDSKG